MKRLLLLTVFAIVAGALLMQLIRHDSGYFIVHIAGYTLQSSFWVAIGVILLSVFAVRYLFVLSRLVWRKTLGRFALWRRQSASRHAHTGLVYFFESDWQASKKELIKAATDKADPLVHYLAAARSAHELGLKEESLFLLKQAKKSAPQQTLVIALNEAKIQLDNGDYQDCIDTLAEPYKTHPRHPVILDLLGSAYVGLQNWQALIALLPDMAAAKIKSRNEQQEFAVRVYLSHLQSLGKDIGVDEAHLVRVWRYIPKTLRNDHRLVTCYAHLLLSLDAVERAEIIVRQTLNKQWNPHLIALYGRIAITDIKAQLHAGEAWLQRHPHDADLLLALGQICMRAQLWGKAKDYLQQSLDVKEQVQTCATLGELLAILGQHRKSTAMYQRGLNLQKTRAILPQPFNESLSS